MKLIKMIIILSVLLIAGAPIERRPSGVETLSQPKVIATDDYVIEKQTRDEPPASRDGSSWVGPWYAPTATPQPYPEPYPAP